MSDGSSNQLTPRERLQELYRRLNSLPKMNSPEEAFRQLCEMLEQVEDELSGVPRSASTPALSQSDGRMYGPLEDHVVRRANGSILALTRGHRIEVGSDATLRIVNKLTGQVEFQK